MVRPSYDIVGDTLYFHAGDEPSRALARADEDLAAVINTIGEVRVDIEVDGFHALARAICDQQISLHAARAIWQRLVLAAGGAVTPENVAALSEEQLRACGFSRSKTRYLHDLAARTLDSSLDFDALSNQEDEAVIATLSQVKGVGRWTAEMFLIFSLKRLDVFALDDGGLRRGVARLKGLPSDAPKPLVEAISEAWAPYRTCASLYLWRWINDFPTL